MTQGIATIELSAKEKKKLNKRRCIICGNKLTKLPTEGIKQWMNRQTCCKDHAIQARMDFGLDRKEWHYKVRLFGNGIWTVSVPIQIIRSNPEILCGRFRFEELHGKLFIYYNSKIGYKVRATCASKGKIRQYGLTIPHQYVKKYKLAYRKFKCELINGNLVYELFEKEVNK